MIRARIVTALFRKDLVDAIRETRIVVSLLTPILLAVIYNSVFPDAKAQVVKTAYAGPEGTAVVRLLLGRADASQSTELRLRHVASADDARQLVFTKDVDVAFVLPEDVDDAIRGGRAPTIRVIQPDLPSAGAAYVQGSLETAARTLAAQRPPAVVTTETASGNATEQSVLSQLGPRKYFVLATIVMMIGMIAVLAVPIMLTEEVERKTLDALLLVGSYLEVIAAKALVGLAYVAVSVVVMLGLTRLRPDDQLTFGAGTLVVAVALIGLGLLIGGLFRNAQQVYSWSSVILIPVILPAFVTGLPLPAWLDALLRATPTGQGMRIIANGLAGHGVFTEIWQSYAVVLAWCAAVYGVLAWQLARRES